MVEFKRYMSGGMIHYRVWKDNEILMDTCFFQQCVERFPSLIDADGVVEFGRVMPDGLSIEEV